jgi:peptidoglycan/LPS O-acetylase OafA/YrhL
MQNLFKQINHKANSFIWSLMFTGFILIVLALLIWFTDFMLRFMVGLLIILAAGGFFYGAFKLRRLKKEFEKFFRLNK